MYHLHRGEPVADIQAYPGVGPRVPAFGDEVNTDAAGNEVQDVKTLAFVLLVTGHDPSAAANASEIQNVETFRTTWLDYVNGPATGGRGRFDSRLNPPIH